VSARAAYACAGHYAGCTADPPANRRMCDSCRESHNARAAERRAVLRAKRRCIVCGRQAVRVDGAWLSTCDTHREYYRARAAGAR
jgi:hypothetical protein